MKAGKNSLKPFTRPWDLVKRAWANQFIRFLIVGGINTAFGYLVYAIFILLHVHYAVSLFLGQTMGILFNFNTTGRIVFKNSDYRLLLRFFAVYVVTYFVNLGALRGLQALHLNLLIAQLILVLPIAILAYFLNKTFVFPKTTQKNG